MDKKITIKNINKLLYNEDPVSSILLELRELILGGAGGFGAISKISCLQREGLYRIFSENGNPKLITFLSIIRSLDLEIQIIEKTNIKNTASLDKTHPELSEEWDFSLNHTKPEHYKANSQVRVNWVCKINNEHKFNKQIAKRVNYPKCPLCLKKEQWDKKSDELKKEAEKNNF